MTLNEIAKIAGVSRTTASYIINGKAKKHRISAETEAKVISIIKEHNYQPNHAASTLRGGSSRSLGLVIPDFENSSYARIAKRLEQGAREKGYQFIISCTDDNPEIEKQVVQTLLNRKIDLLVVASTLQSDTTFYQNIQKKGIPIIAIDRALDSNFFANIVSDDYLGAMELCQHLLKNHFKVPTSRQPPVKFGFIGAHPELNVSKQREAGLNKALSKQTIPIQVERCYASQFERQQGLEITTAWLNKGFIPDLILTTSYTLCEGILDCILAHKKELGGIKLATFGDHSLLDFVGVPVTSLVQQYDQLVNETLSVLFKALEGEYRTGTITINRLLIER